MTKVTFNILSQSSNKEDVVSEIQSGTKNDVLEQNKSDEQHTTTDNEKGKDIAMEMVKDKTIQ
eukprot:11919872-Ditylum_brightwellii.AAC.1